MNSFEMSQCHGRKFRHNVESIGILIKVGLDVHGQYQRVTNVTERNRREALIIIICFAINI